MNRQEAEAFRLMRSEKFPSLAAVIGRAGLAWGVEKHPLWVRLPYARRDGERIEGVTSKRANGFWGITRDDNDYTLATVGAAYEPISNEPALAPVDRLVESGHFTLRGAGSFERGKHVWAYAAMDPLIIAGDQIDVGVFARFSHGGGGLGYTPSFNRHVCLNQLNSLLQGIGGIARKALRQLESRFRHTKGTPARLQGEAVLDVNKIVLVREAFDSEAQKLLAAPWSRSEMEKLIRKLNPEPDRAIASKRAITSWDNRFEAIMECYDAPDLANVRGTQWQALNAITDFDQHYARVTGDEAKRQERLMEKMLDPEKLVLQAEAILREERK